LSHFLRRTGAHFAGKCSSVGDTMNFIGGRGSRAVKSSSMSFVQLRAMPERPNSAGRQRISERSHAEHKADAAASEDQAQSRVGVDATLLPAF
jgi:hypothetical protein